MLDFFSKRAFKHRFYSEGSYYSSAFLLHSFILERMRMVSQCFPKPEESFSICIFYRRVLFTGENVACCLCIKYIFCK